MAHICTIISTIMIKTATLEEGYFELPVEVSMVKASASGDPKGFINKEIARHLAGCVKDTGLPLHEGIWQIIFTQFAQNNLNYAKGYVI